MAHSNVAGSTTSTDKIISSIRLPDGNVYEVHDSSAIHDVSELGLSAALVFKGTKATVANLPSTGNKTGDVWGVGDQEYVWVNRKIAISSQRCQDVELATGVYAELVSTTPLTKSQLIGATVSLYDVVDGARTITIDESKIKGETSDGLYVDCGYYFYIIVVYNEGYTPNISFLGNAFSKTGVYFSHTGLYDHQRVEELTLNEGDWELLGSVHDAASSTHKHNIKDVKGTNKSSAVTGNVNVPSISATTKHLTAPTSSVLGANTQFSISGTRYGVREAVANVTTGVAVGADGTAKAITGFSTHTTAAAITALNTQTINNPTATAGTAASWNASVTNGVLSFDFTPNTPTAVSTSPVSVATSAKATANAITALGTPTTATALTGVKVTSQPRVSLNLVDQGDIQVVQDVHFGEISVTPEEVNAVTGITVGNSASTGSTPIVSDVTIGSATVPLVNATAAAQEWSFTSGETDIPKE